MQQLKTIAPIFGFLLSIAALTGACNAQSAIERSQSNHASSSQPAHESGRHANTKLAKPYIRSKLLRSIRGYRLDPDDDARKLQDAFGERLTSANVLANHPTYLAISGCTLSGCVQREDDALLWIDKVHPISIGAVYVGHTVHIVSSQLADGHLPLRFQALVNDWLMKFLDSDCGVSYIFERASGTQEEVRGPECFTFAVAATEPESSKKDRKP